MKQLEETLNLYLVKKAPKIPANIKELLVTFTPWLTLVGIVMALPAILALVGFGGFFYGAYYAYGFQENIMYILGIAVLAISTVLRGLAIPGLFSRSKTGWNMLYFSTLVYAAYNLVRFDLISLIVGTLISLYLLFQVREYYK